MQNKSFDRNDSKTEIDEEQLRTLWCGGISDKVDEEILYELFLNAGPLEKVTIPKDKETKRQKNFAFIVFQHAESTQYAFDLLNGTELFRQPIRLQNKETLSLQSRDSHVIKFKIMPYCFSSTDR